MQAIIFVGIQADRALACLTKPRHESPGFSVIWNPKYSGRNSIFGDMVNRLKTPSEVGSKTMRRSLIYSFATPGDKTQIRRLLSECGLPTLYIHRHIKSFIVTKAAEKIVGVIGMEVYGRMGLLRSLCVDQAYRGQGIARMLITRISAYAQMRNIDRLYVFTWDADKFASKFGFRKIDKKRIPKSIRATWQFRSFKPYPVVCMMMKIAN